MDGEVPHQQEGKDLCRRMAPVSRFVVLALLLGAIACARAQDDTM